MARIGINPARGKRSNYRPASVTLALITYIPDLSGYFKDRLEVLKLVFASLSTNTPQPYDLMVFDNNSCSPVLEFLHEQKNSGVIDYLIGSSENIGKIGALRILFEAAPGEIIAYSDDDIFFYPGWLEAGLEILEHFPKAGMVSSTPVRNAAGHANKSLKALQEQGAPGLSITTEHRIPDEWEADWAISTGRDVEAHLTQTRDHIDTVLRSKAEGDSQVYEAIGSANHFQFITPKDLILQALPDEWSGKLMGHMIELDEAVDNLGYLRLSTTKRFTRHLGNTISPEILAEVGELGLSAEAQPGVQASSEATPRKRHWSLRIPGMRRIYMAIYRKLFDLLYR
jgi:glycosyltransferase involved in cell wall biosynthesis